MERNVLKGLGGDFDNLVEVNLNRTLMLSQSVVRHMIGDGNIGGVIIIIIIIIVSFTPTIAGKTMGAPNSMRSRE